MTVNNTIERFGYPATLVAETDHWVILVRPSQPTLGSLILAAKGEATAFGDLPDGAHAELKRVTAAIERALSVFPGFDRINYLMLMMVDPHVHFHVIPRYEGQRSLGELTIRDAGWPGPPELGGAITIEDVQIAALVSEISENIVLT